MLVRIGHANDSTCSRIAQLTQKTNQFNLTARRYTEGNIRRMAQDHRFLVLWLELRDRFGDEGLVGVLILEQLDSATWKIDTFLLSCRVIGRSVESAFSSALVTAWPGAGGRCYRGIYSYAEKRRCRGCIFAVRVFRCRVRRRNHVLASRVPYGPKSIAGLDSSRIRTGGKCMLETKLTNAVSDVFGIPPEQVQPDTGRDSLGEWDSIGQLRLILSIEKAYGVRFPADELGELTSVQKVQDALNRLRPQN